MVHAPIDVSVVIAAYNAAATVGAAVESALRQEGVAVEVIVVDDASQDTTVEAVRAVRDERVRLLVLEHNGGPGAARNAGFAASRGAWVAVLDADDAFLPGRLARMVARGQSDEADIVVDDLEVTQDSRQPGSPMFGSTLTGRDSIDLATFVGSNLLFGATYTFGYLKPLFRRAFMERHGLTYRCDLRIGEDYQFMAEALAQGGRCVVEPRSGYRYRVGHASTSRRLRPDDVRAMAAAEIDFQRRFRLEHKAARAHHRRMASLDQGLAFLLMVDALKERRFANAAAAACRRPTALRHFWMPIAARWKRMTSQRQGPVRSRSTP
jgi:succinoglycan biosynthesis protein ExoO